VSRYTASGKLTWSGTRASIVADNDAGQAVCLAGTHVLFVGGQGSGAKGFDALAIVYAR
jgi:hypothetical protein